MTVTTAFPATLLKSHLEVDAADRFAARGLCELSVRGPCVACKAVRSGRWVQWSARPSGSEESYLSVSWAMLVMMLVVHCTQRKSCAWEVRVASGKSSADGAEDTCVRSQSHRSRS